MKRALLALFLLTACTDEDRTVSTLVAEGFTDIHAGGYEPFSCGDGDTFKTHFTAKNQRGLVVEGVVCCGWMKSCTVRF